MLTRFHNPWSIARCCASLVMVLLASSASSTNAAQYTYTMIADNQGVLNSLVLNSNRAINDSGEVAFWGVFADDTALRGIFKSDGDGLTTIGTRRAPNSSIEQRSGINNLGTVVFSATGPALWQVGIYTGDGGAVNTVISQTVDGFSSDPSRGFQAASINDAGDVAYIGSRRNFPDQPPPPDNSSNGYYLIEGTTITTIVEVDGSAGNHAPAINNAGQVAYSTRLDGAPSFGVYRYENPGITTVMTGLGNSTRTSMNSAGDLAFEANGEIVAYLDGNLTTIADTEDAFFSFTHPADGGGQAYINDAGDVAFWAGVSVGSEVGSGVFTGPDHINDRVLGTGDSLFGGTVNSISLGGINNQGQIAMMVRLANDGPSQSWPQAIVVATPAPPLDGDHNGDGSVDAADYVAWRKGFGTIFDESHYTAWRSNFGASAAGSAASLASSSVPEPSSAIAALLGLVLLGVAGRRRHVAGFSRAHGEQP